MKKHSKLFVLITLVACLLLTGCAGKGITNKSDERVLNAIDIISDCWKEYYNDSKLNIDDKYLEITNTKVIKIKTNAEAPFEGMDYIVEFSLESNFYNSAPYYGNIGSRYSFVVVYTDGKTEILTTNPFYKYIQQMGPTNFQNIIESIENYHGEYDQVLDIK